MPFRASLCVPVESFRHLRAARYCVFFVATAISPLTLSASSNSVPDWVHAAVATPLPTLPASAKAVVLFADETYTIGTDGRAVDHVRKVIKILRPQGRDDADPVVYYDKDSKVTSMHVWSIDPGGHEYALKDNEILDFGSPGAGGELYSDDRARVAQPPGRDPGGVVAYEYELRERPYVAETSWLFQGELPRIHQSFTLVLPPGFEYTTTWAHHDKLEPLSLGGNTFKWELDQQAEIDLDRVPLPPASGALAGRMTVHYSGPSLPEPMEGTWRGIGEWYDKLAHDRLAASPEIAAKAQELTAGKTDFYARAEAVGNFVQSQIRYYAIELGVGGFQPHPADAIFRGRYGDCKDKATLLSAMLSSVGIHSALLMVDTERGVVDPSAPSIFGNHMIGAIEIPQGYDSPKLHSVVTAKSGKRYLIFDPTWDQTPFGQLESNLQGSYGVLLEGPASQVIQLPILDPDLNRVERSGNFQLSADGTLKGKVTERRFGDLAEARRRIFLLEDQRHQQAFLDRSLGEDLLSASLTDLQVANLTALDKDFTINYKLEVNRFAPSTGGLLMVRPRVLGSEAFPIDHKQRRIGIDLGETMQAKDEFDIELPDGYSVDELPDPVKEDFGFASYESSTALHGRTLHYSRTYVLRELTLPPDKYAALQKLDGVIAADEQNQAILKKSN